MPVDMELTLMAALLKRGRSIDQLSTPLTLLAGALALYGVLMASASPTFVAGMAALALTGLSQKGLALRVALDAELFEVLAQFPGHIDERTKQLDCALSKHLALPSEKAGRPWPERCKGALRLLRWQVLLCGVQWLFVFAIALILTVEL